MATRPSRLERITNLVLALLDSPRPLPLREIGRTVAGYPEDHGALRQAFERDKKTLRDGGIPISTEPIGGDDQFGYRILPEQYYLPDLGLDAAEEQALAFAVAAVRLDGGYGTDALAKLGLTEPRGERPLALLASLPALGLLHEAIRRRSPVAFGYRSREREVEPYGLAFRSGAWYLVGLDRGAPGPSAPGNGALRTFRVDRMESPPVLGPAGRFDPPRIDLDAELRLAPVLAGSPAPEGSLPAGVRHPGTGPAGAGGPHPASVAASAGGPAVADADAPLDVLLEVDGREAPAALAAVGRQALAERGAGGSLRLRCRVADEEAFVRWVAGFGASAELLAPESLRARVVELLESAVRAHEERPARPSRAEGAGGRAGRDSGPSAGVEAALVATGGAAAALRATGSPAEAAGPSANLDAGARLRRLLAILAHLARVERATIADLARRFELSAEALVADLELAACCGLPPYTPDQLLELVVDDEEVHAYHLSALARPPRLTPEEGFAVAAAARALLSVRGAESKGPLEQALAKLEGALGTSRLDVEIEHPELLDALRRAAAGGEVLDLAYLGREGVATPRQVEPYAVVVREGRWYLDAWSRAAGEWRRFLVARVQSFVRTGEPAPARTPPASFAGPRAFVGGERTRRVVVELPEQRRSALDRVAAPAAGPAPAGRVLVALEVADEEWLGRLLLGLPEARVVEPAELAAAPAAAARRALRRYAGRSGGKAPS